MPTRARLACLVVLLSAVVGAGCAKRPNTFEIARPAQKAPTVSTAVVAADVGQKSAPAESTAKAAVAAVAPERVEPLHPANVAARPEPREFAATPRLFDIHFDFDAYMIRPEDSKNLDANVDWMQSNPNYLILIEGHCDEWGTNEYNLALGEHRARATMDYLLAHGVRPERITTLSYGEERPLCIDRTDACWALNRRAHFLVKHAKPPR